MLCQPNWQMHETFDYRQDKQANSSLCFTSLNWQLHTLFEIRTSAYLQRVCHMSVSYFSSTPTHTSFLIASCSKISCQQPLPAASRKKKREKKLNPWSIGSFYSVNKTCLFCPYKARSPSCLWMKHSSAQCNVTSFSSSSCRSSQEGSFGHSEEDSANVWLLRFRKRKTIFFFPGNVFILSLFCCWFFFFWFTFLHQI